VAQINLVVKAKRMEHELKKALAVNASLSKG